MTLEELQNIFAKAEVGVYAERMYSYYMISERNRGTGVVAHNNLESLVPLLEGYDFTGYDNGCPRFQKPEIK